MTPAQQAIAKRFTKPSRFFESNPLDDPEREWNNTHDWYPVESARGYTVWLDTGYGLMVLTRGGELLDSGRLFVAAPGGQVVGLDRSYYNTAKYLFFSE